MSFLKLARTCSNDCLYVGVDTEDCITDLTKCVRDAGTCGTGCTCLDLGLTKTQMTQGPDPAFLYCFCSSADDHKSLVGTTVVTLLSANWPSDSAVTDVDLAALAAFKCEAPADVIWQWWSRSEPQPCPVSTSGWSPQRVSLDGGTTYIESGTVTNPAPGQAFTFYSGPVLVDGETDIYDCADAPAAILLQIKTSCGGLLVLCPVQGADGNIVVCPVPPRCCCPSLSVVTADSLTPPDDDGEGGAVTLSYTVHLTSAIAPCECNSRAGSIGVSKGGVFIDSHDISGIADDGDGSGSFVVPWDGTDSDSALITIDWSDSQVCEGGAGCPCPAVQCYAVTLTSGVFGPTDCPT